MPQVKIKQEKWTNSSNESKKLKGFKVVHVIKFDQQKYMLHLIAMKSGGQVKDLPVHHRPPLVHEEPLEPLGCSDRTTGSLTVPSPRSWSQLLEPSVMCGGTSYSRGGPTNKTKGTPNQQLDPMITSWSKLYWIHVNVHNFHFTTLYS